jgi:hypothetical protein
MSRFVCNALARDNRFRRTAEEAAVSQPALMQIKET